MRKWSDWKFLKIFKIFQYILCHFKEKYSSRLFFRNMRGDEIEEGDWTKDARGFIADFYDEYYADSPSSQS